MIINYSELGQLILTACYNKCKPNHNKEKKLNHNFEVPEITERHFKSLLQD